VNYQEEPIANAVPLNPRIEGAGLLHRYISVQMKPAFALLCLVLLGGCASPPQKTPNNPPSAALDEKWKGHGSYFQKIINSVDKKWASILSRSKEYPASGTTVVVKFRIEAKTGDVIEIINVDSTGTKNAAEMCVSAIAAGAPYGPWSPEMKNTLGDSTEVTFTFNYQ
jgi:hypothetical protein